MAQTDNQKGVSLLMIAMFAFVTGDSIFQFLSGDIPLPQFLFVRGLLAVLLMGWFVKRSGKPFPHSRRVQVLMFARAFVELSVALSFMSALKYLPITEVTAINQTVPLVMTFVAYVFLGERFGWRRLVAIFAGFLGVLLIIKPGFSEFNIGYILALYAVCAITLRDMIARQMPKDVPSIWVAFVTLLVVCLASGVIAWTQDWVGMNTKVLSLTLFCSVLATLGHLSIVAAMRVGELSFVAPFRYAAIFLTALIDLFIFNRPLDRWSILGCILIAGAGIFTLRREANRAEAGNAQAKS